MDGDRLDVFDDDGGRPLDSTEREPARRDPVGPATRGHPGAALEEVRPLLVELLWEHAKARVVMRPDVSATLEAALQAWDADARADEDARRPPLATIDQMESALSDALEAIDASHVGLRLRVQQTRDGLHEAGDLLAHDAGPTRDVLGQRHRPRG
jgi:hypothetical protein